MQNGDSSADMTGQDTPRNGSPLRAALVLLLLLPAAGAVLYAASGNPLPSFLARYFDDAGGHRQDAPPTLRAPGEGDAGDASALPRPSFSDSWPAPGEAAPSSARNKTSRSPSGWSNPILPEIGTRRLPREDGLNREDEQSDAATQKNRQPEAERAGSVSVASRPEGREDARAKIPEEDIAPPPPDSGGGQAEEAIPRPAAGERHPGDESDDSGPMVVRYGRGLPVEGKPSLVRGRIERAAPAGRVTQDIVVGSAFIQDLATFLAENYWPRGTHPFAQNSGLTTAGLRWANMRYGGGLTALGIDAAEPASGRQRLLEYVFTPGMIRGLYRLHADRFCNALEAAARSRTTERGPLDASQRAEMFAIYSRMAKGLSGCIRAYQRTPGIRALVASYAAASDKAAEDFMRYAGVMDGPPKARTDAAERYQESVLLRDQQKNHLAAAMRRGGDTRGLDSDSLVYAALWLHRRGEERDAAFTAAAEVCAACSERLLKISRTHAP